MNLTMIKNDFGEFVFISEDEEIKCKFCKKEIKSGFVCENDNNFIMCRDCMESYNHLRIKRDSFGEVRLIKFNKK